MRIMLVAAAGMLIIMMALNANAEPTESIENTVPAPTAEQVLRPVTVKISRDGEKFHGTGFFADPRSFGPVPSLSNRLA